MSRRRFSLLFREAIHLLDDLVAVDRLHLRGGDVAAGYFVDKGSKEGTLRQGSTGKLDAMKNLDVA